MRTHLRPTLLVGLLLLSTAAELHGRSVQLSTQQVRGVVQDFLTGAPVGGATVRVQGTDQQVVTGPRGRFFLRDVPSGAWVLEVLHPEYGPRTYEMDLERGGFAEVEINLTRGSAEAAPTVTAGAPVRDPAATLGHVAGQEEIARAAESVMNLGELVRRVVPALRSRQAEGRVGDGLCLEFRSAGARSGRSLLVGPDTGEEFACNHPLTYMDGVVVQDPGFAYGMTALGDIRRVQAIPPAEAGARFGSAPHGVLIIETRFMTGTTTLPGVGSSVLGAPTGSVPRRRSSFDWTLDPAGHSFAKTFLGALAGNAVGLAAGVSVGRECVFIEERTRDIEFSCGNAGVAGAGVAAVLLPALGSAVGARFGGRTDGSVGRLVPAVVGGAMGALPGYIFSLATVGEGVDTMNTIGKAFLVLGPPLLTTFADRLFRNLRD